MNLLSENIENEYTRIRPIFQTQFLAARNSADINDNACNHESNYCGYFDNRKYHFAFSIAAHTGHVDKNYQPPEEGDPEGDGETRIPEGKGQACGHEFKRKHHKPLHSVIPSHRKTPRFINKSGGEDSKRSYCEFKFRGN